MNETKKRKIFWKEPASALTHFLGFGATLIGFLYLLQCIPHTPEKVITFTIYGICLCLLFLASASYHFFDLGTKGNLWLRRGDHSAIFLLIAGSYVPAFVHLLDGKWRFWMLFSTATLTILGIIFKLTWFHAPRWVDAGMYLLMGWMIIIPGYLMLQRIENETLYFMILGGAFYTVGAIIYALKKPDPWPGVFGFHEVWHLFVIGGASAHYFFVLSLTSVPII